MAAANVEEKIDAYVDTEGMGTAPPTNGQNDSSDAGYVQIGSIPCRTKLVYLGKQLLHLVCLGYSFYLIWLLAYLKDNNNYWFLSFIPLCYNFVPFLFLCKAYHKNGIVLEIISQPSYGVVFNLMVCFTMLTRQAYYSRQPDHFIGPRFIILSLQASIILILLDFVLERVRKQQNLLDYKDVLARMLLDFVDIFNMVEILSVNVCVGVGSYVSEDSSTERAIQAFCTMSFWIVLPLAQTAMGMVPQDGEYLYSKITISSSVLQNIPFLVIRIVAWVQYNLYNLGFLVKNVFVIVLSIAILCKNGFKALYTLNNHR